MSLARGNMKAIDSNAPGNESFETGVACAVEVSIEGRRPRIDRATITVDPGFAVNPLTIESRCKVG
jgi:CO/xanthine dehydrogenase Mo-binding subunit